MERIYKTFLIVGVIGFLFFAFLFTQNQSMQISLTREQAKVQKEEHLLTLYAEYKNNIDNCRQAALSQGKDEDFIRINCIEVINSSLIGELLKGWNREALLITK